MGGASDESLVPECARMATGAGLPPREGKLEQVPIEEIRTFRENVLVFLERYVDNAVYHMVIFLITIAFSIANLATMWSADLSSGGGNGVWSFLLGVLVGYAVCDIPIMIATSQVGFFFTFNWIDLMCDVAVSAAVFSSARRHVIPLILCLKFFINFSRSIQKFRLLVAVNKRVFKDGPFHLDLSFVTNRAVAMGLPAQGLPWTIYRNSIVDVARSVDGLNRGEVGNRRGANNP